MKRVVLSLVAVMAAACSPSSGGSAPATCDSSCEDGVALLALRDAIKVAYNLKLQGGPTGPQDAGGDCPFGGTVQITGTATSVAEQGVTMVDLAYQFSHCTYMETDTDPKKTFRVTIDGTVTETGTIAVDPSSTTALKIHSTSLTLEGTVFAPAKELDAGMCDVTLQQDGDHLSGLLCEREAGVSL